ncbi:DegV family protein [Peribacillus saganii]|uniref:DegV family protein n=1 Tax=Peribacillus saganii TaxID=2303992 RepID=A0A372LKB6_9BACI|nr:DegV family protein [Peribacillus saganii]RFU66466.1 DegV family protein [Peribacillus saganii]
MVKVKIVTDSTADMSAEELEEYGVTMVPLSITIDGETFLDKVDMFPEEFITRMKSASDLPKSSQPPAGKFVEVYEELAKDGSEIISIHMTGGMSGTVRSAESAATMTEAKVTVFDSKFISKALSFQVIEAAKMAASGKSTAEIIKRLEEIRRNSTLYIAIDTLENLVKGGRIGKAAGFIGSLLNIKPIARLEDGVLNQALKARSQSQIVKLLLKQFMEDTKGKEILGVGIAHVNGQELANKLKQAIIDNSGFQNVEVVFTTPVISTHAGPGAVGFMYYSK